MHVMSRAGQWRRSVGNSAYIGGVFSAGSACNVIVDSPQGVCVDNLNRLYVACFGKAHVLMLV